jgi:mono/diheme cytochrome c family protein
MVQRPMIANGVGQRSRYEARVPDGETAIAGAVAERPASSRSRRVHQGLASTLLWLGVAGAVACEGASSATPGSSRYVAGGIPNLGQGGGTGTSGLPCPVADVLAAYCIVCHSNPPKQGVPVALASYADLAATSAVDPSTTVAQRCEVRMQDTQSPMPPGAAPSVPAADVATVQAWIDAGMPTGECGADGGTNPFNASPICSSGSMWQGGEDGADLMHPGLPCIGCHLQNGGEAPIFGVAGTVYPTAHEPNECLATGLIGAASVEIHDVNGQVISLGVNSSGNFTYGDAGFAYPYSAKVLFEGRERAMAAVQTSGDCNGCHTQDGSQGAPGRILLP